MKAWHIERVPDDLDKAVREAGALRGENLRTTVLRLLWDGVRTEHVRITDGARTQPVRTAHTEAPEPRHGAVRELIEQEHKRKFGSACQWDGSEGKRLSEVLKANPSWTMTQIAGMVRNRYESAGVTGDRPRVWLPNLSKYAGGPLDRFGKNGDTRQQEIFRKPPPMVNALDIKREQEAEARAKGEIE
jgi:hypothetical protein